VIKSPGRNKEQSASELDVVSDGRNDDVTKQDQLGFGECWRDSEHHKQEKQEAIQVFFT